jgi:small conductance mechanosensitive channel
MNFIYFIDSILKTNNEDISIYLNIFSKILKIVVVFIVIKILSRILNAIISKMVERRKHSKLPVDERKLNTLSAVLKNVIRYTIYFIGVMIILDILGVNTNSIIATAGIGGLAISFGAQSLVKDIITGFFILFEDQFSVGDYIQIGDFEGIVVEMGIRVTKIRDFSGELHIIPNGNISIVTNKSRGPMSSYVDVRIPYEEDVDRAIRIIEEACEKVKENNDTILEGPSVLGITDLGDSGINIKIIAKTEPMNQWALERQLRKEIKKAFDAENIQIAYPKLIIQDRNSRG